MRVHVLIPKDERELEIFSCENRLALRNAIEALLDEYLGYTGVPFIVAMQEEG